MGRIWSVQRHVRSTKAQKESLLLLRFLCALSGSPCSIGGRALSGHTEGYIAVAHPRCHLDGLVRSESRNLFTCEQVPDNGRLTVVVGHHQPPCAPFANIIDGNELYILVMIRKLPLYRQGIMMEAVYGRSLCEEEEGGCSSARLERRDCCCSVFALECGGRNRLCLRRWPGAIARPSDRHRRRLNTEEVHHYRGISMTS